MTACRSCMKCLKITCFLLWLVVEILQFVHDIRSCAEVLYKGVRKNFSKLTEKKKKQSSGGALLKDVLKI